MKKEIDFKKKAEIYQNLVVVLMVIIMIMAFFWCKSYLKTQNVIGYHLNTMTLTLMKGADFLAQSENDQDKIMMAEMIYDTIADTQESLEEVVGDCKALRVYAYKTDELAYHLLDVRLEYQDKDIDYVVEEIQNIAKAVSDSGIRKVVSREGYLYSFDSKGVKEDLDEILNACYEF